MKPASLAKAAAGSDRAREEALAIAPNRAVSLACTLRGEDGGILGDPRDGEVDYVHGYGMLVPGLEAALAGLVPGDRREIVVPPASGYGDHDPDLVMEIERSELPNPERVVAGDEFDAEWPDGGTQTLRVLEVREDTVVVDSNHPLAGMTLRYSVEVRTVRAATAAEVDQAAREQDEAEDSAHAEGCGCDHDHDHDGPDPHEGHGDGLITLGRKKPSPS